MLLCVKYGTVGLNALYTIVELQGLVHPILNIRYVISLKDAKLTMRIIFFYRHLNCFHFTNMEEDFLYNINFQDILSLLPCKVFIIFVFLCLNQDKFLRAIDN